MAHPHHPPTRHRPPLLAALVAACCITEAQAADPTPSVLVSGSRTAVNPDTPAATDSIDRTRLAELNIANPEDSIKYLPNIAVRKRYIGDRNGGIETRGTNNRQTARALVLADGVLLSNLLGSQNQIAPRWSMVFPEEIDRVDVIYGPFSALYSGNAMGAAVLFTTRMPRDFEAHAAVQLQRQRFEFLDTRETLAGNLANAFIGDRSGAWSYQLGLSRLESTSQPTGFAAVAPSSTPSTAADRPVTRGHHTVQDRFGNPQLLLGVGGGGIEKTMQTDLKLKLAYDWTPQTQTRLQYTRWSNDRSAGAPGQTTWLRDAAGEPVYAGPVAIEGRRYVIGAGTFAPRNGRDEHRNLALMLKSRPEHGWHVDAVASVYDIAQDRTRTASTAPPAAFSGGAGSLNIQDGSGWRTLDIKFDRRPQEGGQHAWTLGAHWSRTRFRQENLRTADWLRAETGTPNTLAQGDTELAALFVQDAWRFAPEWKAVTGLRLERWRSRDAFSRGGTPAMLDLPDRSESAVSPKLALEYSPQGDWQVRAAVARATRFPTPMELFFGNVSSQQLATPDPNLRPETGLFSELSWEWYLPKGSLRATVYREQMSDAIFNLANTTSVPSNATTQNIQRVRTQGLELAFDTRGLLLPQLDLSGSLAFNDAITQRNPQAAATEGLRYPGVPRVRASFTGIWRFDEALSVSLAGRHSGRQFGTLDNSDTNAAAYNATGSFTVLDARANWRVHPRARLSLGVDNLTDKVYFNGHPFPARSLVAELKLSY